MSRKALLTALAVGVTIPALVVPVNGGVVHAEEVSPTPNAESDFVGFEKDQRYSITDYVGESKDVVIPETIGGTRVYTVKNNAFKGKGLTSVILPKSLGVIGIESFSGNKLKELKIPDGGNLNFVGEKAFERNQITKLSIGTQSKDVYPKRLDVKERAFADNNIKELTLGTNLNNQSLTAFDGNKDIEKVEFGDEVAKGNYVSIGNIESGDGKYIYELIFRNNIGGVSKEALLYGTRQKEGIKGYFTIPDYIDEVPVTEVRDYNPVKGHRITGMTVGKNVRVLNNFSEGDIKELKFSKERNLKQFGSMAAIDVDELVFPEGLEKITSDAVTISDVNKLVLPKSLETIDKGAFYYHNNNANLSRTDIIIQNKDTFFNIDSFKTNSEKSKMYNMITFYGIEQSYANDYAKTNGISFRGIESAPIIPGYNDTPVVEPEPEEPPVTEPETPETPSTDTDWSLENPTSPFKGVIPTITVMGGKPVKDITIKNVEWVTTETDVETPQGTVTLKPDGEGNTLVSVKEGLGDKATATTVNVEFEGTNFLDINIVKAPELNFGFSLKELAKDVLALPMKVIDSVRGK